MKKIEATSKNGCANLADIYFINSSRLPPPCKSRNLSLLKQRKKSKLPPPSNLCNRNLCARQFYSKILSVYLQIGIFRRNASFFIVLFQKNAAIASRRKFLGFCGCKPPFERASFFQNRGLKLTSGKPKRALDHSSCGRSFALYCCSISIIVAS